MMAVHLLLQLRVHLRALRVLLPPVCLTCSHSKLLNILSCQEAAVLTSTGYAFESSFQAASPVITSSQPWKASEQTIDQTAAPTTVTEGVQLASQSTIASTTVVYTTSSAVTSSSAASAPTSTTCGEYGSFTLDVRLSMVMQVGPRVDANSQ